jgi:hypothetical protein
MQFGHRLKVRELLYLHEDLTNSILKIQNRYALEYYDQVLLGEIQEQLVILASIHIGAEGVLNSIQYLLGEIQTGLWDQEPLYIDLEFLIAQIQNYLD